MDNAKSEENGDGWKIRPVILSGGSGTRLWPLSRVAYPKQLLSLTASETMFQATLARFKARQFLPCIIVGDEQHRLFIKDQLEQVHATSSVVLLEPKGRNTAAAAAIAAHWCLSHGEDDLLLVVPSDHVIADPKSFYAALDRAIPAAEKGVLVTFGIQPSSPKTGYGYIELGAPVDDMQGVFNVARFIEKPPYELARELVQAGHSFWNAGIFLFRASSLIRELTVLAPEISDHALDSIRQGSVDGLFVRPDAAAFERIERTSIDFAVMERTKAAAVVPVDMAWSDVGTWQSLWEFSDRDERGNAVRGNVVAIDTNDCLIRSEIESTVAVAGLRNMALVVTRDAILVTPLDRSEDVKILVDALIERGAETALAPAVTYCPWGSYETMDRGERFQTKHIIVKPGAALSLQKHHHRSEHWVVVKGTAEVTVGDDVRLLQENESTYIPAGMQHRLANPGRVPLHLVEVQCGPYQREDDIVRLGEQLRPDLKDSAR